MTTKGAAVEYLSKGAQRFFVAVAVVLGVLVLPLFSDTLHDVWRGVGVPAGWSVGALIALVSLSVGLSVGWLLHRLQRAILSRRRGA